VAYCGRVYGVQEALDAYAKDLCLQQLRKIPVTSGQERAFEVAFKIITRKYEELTTIMPN